MSKSKLVEPGFEVLEIQYSNDSSRDTASDPEEVNRQTAVHSHAHAILISSLPPYIKFGIRSAPYLVYREQVKAAPLNLDVGEDIWRRFRHAMVSVQDGKFLVMYGGLKRGKLMDDLFVLQFGEMQLEKDKSSNSWMEWSRVCQESLHSKGPEPQEMEVGWLVDWNYNLPAHRCRSSRMHFSLVVCFTD